MEKTDRKKFVKSLKRVAKKKQLLWQDSNSNAASVWEIAKDIFAKLFTKA